MIGVFVCVCVFVYTIVRVSGVACVIKCVISCVFECVYVCLCVMLCVRICAYVDVWMVAFAYECDS